MARQAEEQRPSGAGPAADVLALVGEHSGGVTSDVVAGALGLHPEVTEGLLELLRRRGKVERSALSGRHRQVWHLLGVDPFRSSCRACKQDIRLHMPGLLMAEADGLDPDTPAWFPLADDGHVHVPEREVQLHGGETSDAC